MRSFMRELPQFERNKCDQMARSFFQYLGYYNKENLPQSIKISHSRFKIFAKD